MASQKEKEHTRKIANMMTRGILESFTNGSVPTIKGTLFADEVQEGLEMAQQFGFASNPVIGSNILTTFLGGNRDLGFVTQCLLIYCPVRLPFMAATKTYLTSKL